MNYVVMDYAKFKDENDDLVKELFEKKSDITKRFIHVYQILIASYVFSYHL